MSTYRGRSLLKPYICCKYFSCSIMERNTIYVLKLEKRSPNNLISCSLCCRRTVHFIRVAICGGVLCLSKIIIFFSRFYETLHIYVCFMLVYLCIGGAGIGGDTIEDVSFAPQKHTLCDILKVTSSCDDERSFIYIYKSWILKDFSLCGMCSGNQNMICFPTRHVPS